MIVLNKNNIKDYLIEKKIIRKQQQIKIKKLKGGNVNLLFLIKTKTKQFVIKQATEEAVNIPGFPIDQDRNKYEVAAIKIISKLLKKNARIPKLYFEDKENHIFTMSLVPENAKLYQTELMAGKFHFDIVYQLAIYTAALHSATYKKEFILKQFKTNPGYKLREITTTPAFKKYPEQQMQFEEAFKKNQINKICLVDGDITPKNILIHDNTFTKVDFDIIQAGDPAQELGIILAHFLLPAIANPQWKEEYFECVKLFYNTYVKYATYKIPNKFFMNMKNYTALMMIGRIDSAFTFTWLKSKKDLVRKMALELFNTNYQNINQLLSSCNKNFLLK